MTATPEPNRENTYVIDPESGAEMARLLDQDRLITRAMGGLFPQRLDLSEVQRVLDIACGPGGWAQEVAFQYPEMDVVGVDISRAMITYATAQCRVQKLDNATFQVMDATKKLEFPDNSFDMINARFLVGFISSLAAWTELIQECLRVLRPGGTLRLTECDEAGVTNSKAYEEMKRIGLRAGIKLGRNFSPTGRDAGITPLLGGFMRDAGFQNVSVEGHALEISAGTDAHINTYENFKVAYKLIQPFVVKAGVTTSEEIEGVYQQMLAEILSNQFRGIWYFLSIIGQKPE